MALSANRELDFELATERSVESKAPTLVVSAARALDPALVRAIGLDPDQIRSIWEGRSESPGGPASARSPVLPVVEGMSLDRLRNDAVPACTLPSGGARSIALSSERAKAASGRSASDAQERDYIAAWKSSLHNTNGIGRYATVVMGGAIDTAQDVVRRGRAWITSQMRDPTIGIGARTSLVIGQSLSGSGPESLVTVVTAPNTAALQASVTCLTAPAIWSRLEGHIAALDANDGTLTTYETHQGRLVEADDQSFANLRLAFAGWLSMNPMTYVFAIFMAAAALGASTSSMLRDLGRRNPGRETRESETNGPDHTAGEA
jgi:cellulose synthase operon protein B